MMYFSDEEKIDHRKLQEVCDCFNALIKMQENLHQQEQYALATVIHETAIELAESLVDKLK